MTKTSSPQIEYTVETCIWWKPTKTTKVCPALKTKTTIFPAHIPTTWHKYSISIISHHNNILSHYYIHEAIIYKKQCQPFQRQKETNQVMIRASCPVEEKRIRIINKWRLSERQKEHSTDTRTATVILSRKEKARACLSFCFFAFHLRSFLITRAKCA